MRKRIIKFLSIFLLLTLFSCFKPTVAVNVGVDLNNIVLINIADKEITLTKNKDIEKLTKLLNVDSWAFIHDQSIKDFEKNNKEDFTIKYINTHQGIFKFYKKKSVVIMTTQNTQVMATITCISEIERYINNIKWGDNYANNLGWNFKASS